MFGRRSGSDHLDVGDIQVFSNEGMITSMFDFIVQRLKEKQIQNPDVIMEAKVYFHNLRYDRTLFEKDIYIKKVITKNNQIYRIFAFHLCIEDSFKLISHSLSKFAKTFDLPNNVHKVECINYDYYTPENLKKHVLTTMDDSIVTILVLKVKKLF